MSRVVDVEILRSPALNIVQIAGGLDIPGIVWVSRIAHLLFPIAAHYKRMRQDFNTESLEKKRCP
jgi:hypothetical protein